MAVFPAFEAGDTVTAQMLLDMQPTVVMATVAQTVNNSTSFASDNTLTIPVVANAGYLIEFFMIFSQSSTLAANAKTDWTVPTGVTGIRQTTGPTSGAGFGGRTSTNARFSSHVFTTAVGYGLNNAASQPTIILEKGIVNVAGTGGNVTIRWAQLTAQAQNLSRDPFSFVRATRFA